MSISADVSGDWDDTEAWLKKMAEGANIFAQLEHYGAEGVAALAAATPSESGETAAAWFYEILEEQGSWSIVWGNNHVEDGRQIAVLLEYGHGTRTGGYVAPQPYINDALNPIFDRAEAEGWRVVIQS